MDKSKSHPDGPEKSNTHFGFETVGLDDKQGRVDVVFDKVAARYDLMNDIMSGGLHRAWKSVMVEWLAPPRSSRSFEIIDVAGGTGDIAFRLAERAGDGTHVTVCDINSSMVSVGARRAIEYNLSHKVDFTVGNAETLGFPRVHFDAYTIAFGIRNVPRIDLALAEAYRVLRPGGRFLCLEFSNVDTPGLDIVYDAYSFGAIPKIGKFVTGDAQPYQYLVESIRKFPGQDRFKQMIEEAGFERVSYRNLSGGIAAIHSGWRL